MEILNWSTNLREPITNACRGLRGKFFDKNRLNTSEPFDGWGLLIQDVAFVKVSNR